MLHLCPRLRPRPPRLLRPSLPCPPFCRFPPDLLCLFCPALPIYPADAVSVIFMKHSSDHTHSYIPEPSAAPSCLQDKLLTSRHVVQSLSCVQLFATLWTIACQAFLSFTIFWSLLRFRSMESVILSNHLILCCPLLLVPSSFPASESFPMSQLFSWGGQSTGASASASVFPMNIQDWFSLGLTALISLLSKELSRVFSSTIIQKHQLFDAQPSLWSNSHIHTWLLEKP